MHKPTMEGVSKVIEMCRLVRVTIWGKTDSLLLGCDRFIEIGNPAQKLEPTLEGGSEVIETGRLARHSVEVMVYQYDKLFGYGCWMTNIPTITHSFIFLGYSEFSSWLPWQPIQYYSTPKVTN